MTTPLHPSEVFNEHRPRQWFEKPSRMMAPLGASGILFSVALVVLAGDGGVDIAWVLINWASVLFFLGVLSASGLFVFEKRYKQENLGAIQARLASYSTGDLVDLAMSPDISGFERNIVMEYLGEHHPGWSTGAQDISAPHGSVAAPQ